MLHSAESKRKEGGSKLLIVAVRDVYVGLPIDVAIETLRPLPPYTPGLLHLMTPYLSSYPSISLLTTDSAQIEYDCPCGRPGPTLRVLGRAGLSKHKGCAITALELLKP